MAIRVSCVCGRNLNLADTLRGKKVRCPECSAAIVVPVSESIPLSPLGKSRSQQSTEIPRRARPLNEESRPPAIRTKPPEATRNASSQTKKPADRVDKQRFALNPNAYDDSDDVEWLDEGVSASWNNLPHEAATMRGRSHRGSEAGRHRGATARSSGKSEMPTVIKVLLIAGAVSIVPILIGIGFVVLKSVGGASSGAGIPDVANLKVKQEIFPQRPVFQPSFPSGVQLARARLTGRGPGEQTQMNIYLPAGEHAARTLGCVLVAPAGTNLLIGNSLDGNAYHDETLPYAEAGFMTVQYSLDGPVSELETATEGELSAAYNLFKAAGAGLLNTRCAIEFVKARFPEVDPARIYTAGHSSAGTVSLLAAEYYSDVAACIAYAPCSDVEECHAGLSDAFGVNLLFPGIAEFDRQFSPMAQVHKLKCPLFVFHARDDSVLEVGISQRFVEQVRVLNQQVEYIEVGSGDHYDSMIQDGIPRAVQWLKKIDSARAVEMKSKPFATLDTH
jgi:dienelactone hydrolase